jgi:hypothetical protein
MNQKKIRVFFQQMEVKIVGFMVLNCNKTTHKNMVKNFHFLKNPKSKLIYSKENPVSSL